MVFHALAAECGEVKLLCPLDLGLLIHLLLALGIGGRKGEKQVSKRPGHMPGNFFNRLVAKSLHKQRHRTGGFILGDVAHLTIR